MDYIVPENKMADVIELWVKQTYPRFNKRDVEIGEVEDGGDYYLEYSDPKDFVGLFATFNPWTKKLSLHWRMQERIDRMFGDHAKYIIDWFNKEFNQDAMELVYF
jgi:hypothetical protein